MYTAYFAPEYSGAALQALTLAKELRARGHDVEFITNRWPGLPRRRGGGRLHRAAAGAGPRAQAPRVAAVVQHDPLRLGTAAGLRRAAQPRRLFHERLRRAAGPRAGAQVGDQGEPGARRPARPGAHGHWEGCTGSCCRASTPASRSAATWSTSSRRAGCSRRGSTTCPTVWTPLASRARARQSDSSAGRRWNCHRIGPSRCTWACWTSARTSCGSPSSGWRITAFGTGALLLAVGPQARDDPDGVLRQRLVELAKTHPGFFALHDFHADVAAYYRCADLLILPSAREGLPNVVLEAMASGLPCVAARASGSRELIVEGETGHTFEPDDPADLARAVKACLSEKGRHDGREGLAARPAPLLHPGDCRRLPGDLFHGAACVGAISERSENRNGASMSEKDRACLLHAYITHGWKDVDGWAAPLLFERVMLIDQLQQQLGIKGHIGEIGVHHGKLFILLHLLRRAGERGLAIDLFEEQDLNVDKSGKGDRNIFVDHVHKLTGDGSQLEIFATDSTKISGADVSSLMGGKLRLLSIDGGHLKNIVAHDLQTAVGCLADGGVVLVDDYLNPEFPGVAEGTLAFLTANRDLRPFCVSTQKLYLTTRGYEDRYVRLLFEAETGRSFIDRVQYNFVPGRNCPVRTADLLDTEVLCYSDDEYTPLQRLMRRTREMRRHSRDTLSKSAIWKLVRHSPAGSLLKTVADRFLPYR